jgi:hypothetical protein
MWRAMQSDTSNVHELPLDCSILVSVPFLDRHESLLSERDWDMVPCALMKRVCAVFLPVGRGMVLTTN